jgi:hypothetical protein
MQRKHPSQEIATDTHSEFDIIDTILQESEAGVSVAALSEKYNLPPGAIYQWRALFLPGFKHQQRVKTLEEENAQLKKFITDAMADGIAAKAHVLSQINSNLRGRIRPRGPQESNLPSSDDPNIE